MTFLRAGPSAPLLAAILATAFHAIATGPAKAQAQAWPAKPIRLVVPFPPGASNDVLSRITAQAMSPGLGQQIVVENRPGGGGIVGTEAVARSPGDGYSMLNIQASFVANAALRPRLPYEPIADFAYVGMMARGPLLMVVHPSLPVRNVREFLALAKSKPGQVNYGSTGTGSHNHMATELFKRMAGINIIHVPYKGAAPALTDLISGQVQLMIDPLVSSAQHVKAGKLRALAVADSRRSPLLPDVPTFAEAGLPGYESLSWFGLLAPAGTPAAIVTLLNSTTGAILANDRDLRARFTELGVEPIGGTPAQLAAFAREETRKWSAVVKKANVAIEGGS